MHKFTIIVGHVYIFLLVTNETSKQMSKYLKYLKLQ